jgi:hypothetical protein
MVPGGMKQSRAITFSAKLLAERSRAPNQSRTDHTGHVFAETAGQAITQPITVDHPAGDHVFPVPL